MNQIEALHENGFYWVQTSLTRPVVLEWRLGQFNGVKPFPGRIVSEMLAKGTMWIAGPLPCPFRIKGMTTDEMHGHKEKE